MQFYFLRKRYGTVITKKLWNSMDDFENQGLT